jgi:hypothetical protein
MKILFDLQDFVLCDFFFLSEHSCLINQEKDILLFTHIDHNSTNKPYSSIVTPQFETGLTSEHNKIISILISIVKNKVMLIFL